MSIQIRRATERDIPEAGRIIYEAFGYIQDKHSFPRDFQSREIADGLAAAWISHPSIYSIIAEVDGKAVGFNAVDQRDEIGAPGPVVVDPKGMGKGVGRAMMHEVMDRAKGMKGMRLIQEAFNTVSMSLYASLGFEVKEPIAIMAGRARDAKAPQGLRRMTETDLPACGELCARVHGLKRTNELRDALKMFEPQVLERGGRIVAYASSPPMWLINHTLAETQADLESLIEGLSATRDTVLLFVPSRQSALFRWCLSRGLRFIKPATLMTTGEYQDPRGAWTPSVLY